MAGLAGAFLSLGYLGLYDSGIAGGRGWIAIIVVIFSRWSPYRAILGSLLFGIGYSMAANLIGFFGSGISYYFLLIMPYLLALIVIVIFVGKKKGPAALTVPYWRK
jgi:simple sugar transport system permease protein